MYGTFASPNPNVSRSRLRFLLKWTRIKHLAYYVAASAFSFRRPRHILERRFDYAFMVCSNTPTHAALLTQIDSRPDLVILPVGFSKDSIPGSNEEPGRSYDVVYIGSLVSVSDIITALEKMLAVYRRSKEALNLSLLDLPWLFVSLIEASAVGKLNIRSIFLTHHLDSPALIALMAKASRYEAGFHGFPVADYGYTPVWTDVFYAYGESTKAYLEKRDPSSASKIRFYKNALSDTPKIESYDAHTLGLIVGGSYEDLISIVAAAKHSVKQARIRELTIFRHPSRQLSPLELKAVKEMKLPFKVTTLKEHRGGRGMRCLIGNSTAIFSALSKGLIVFRTPSTLPTFEEAIYIDHVTVDALENLPTYCYPGAEIHAESIKRQLNFHFA